MTEPRPAAGPSREHEAAALLVVALRGWLSAQQGEARDRRADELAAAAARVGALSGLPYSVMLAPSACLIAGRFLRAPRWVHEAADEVRVTLGSAAIAELLIFGSPAPHELAMLRAACERPGTQAERAEGALRWRPVQPIALVRGIDIEQLDPEEHLETACAWAITALQALTAELDAAPAALDARVRHIARALMALPATNLVTLMHGDRVRERLSAPAERAVGRTLLALEMMRALTRNTELLLETAIAAMLLELVGWPEPGGPARPPALAARRVQAMARTDAGSVMRTVIAYEALRLAQEPQPAGSQPPWVPSVPGCVVYAAWRCFERPDQPLRVAIEQLHASCRTDREREIVRLLGTVTGHRLSSPAAAPRREPRAAPAEGEAAPEPENGFSEAEMADILAELGPPESLPPPASVRPPGRRSSRPAGPQGRDQRVSHAPVRLSDAPGRASLGPPVVPGHLLDDAERAAAAATAFDAAEASWAMGELAEALEHADTAVMLVPYRAAFVALQAYLEALQGEGDTAVHEVLVDRVDRAFSGTDADARAHYYRGLLLRYCGKPFASRQAFRRGLELAPEDPDLLNALQESQV